MSVFPESDDNVVWARDAEAAIARHAGTIELFGSRLAPAQRLLDCHFGSELVRRVREFVAEDCLWGDEELKSRIAAYEGVGADDVLLTAGATQAFDLLCRSFVRPHDELIVERPGYQVLPRIASDYGTSIKYVHREGRPDGIDPDEVRSACTANTRMIAVTNLHNPTGFSLSADLIAQLARVALSFGAILVVDEVYSGYVPTNVRSLTARGPQDGVVRINSLAKSFGVNGLACGWITGPKDLLARLRTKYATSLISVSMVAHRAAVVVFDHLPEYLENQRTVMARNTALLDEFLGEARRGDFVRGTRAEYGPIAFLEFPDAEGSDEIWPWLARTRQVLLIPGGIYGMAGWTRIGYGGNAQRLSEGLERVVAGLKEWRTARRHHSVTTPFGS